MDDQASGRAQSTAAHEPAGSAAAAPVDCCEVCLVAPSEGFALVPCGHALFVELAPNVLLSCKQAVRAAISMVMHVNFSCYDFYEL